MTPFEPPGPDDRDPGNVLLRAGYLLGMASIAEDPQDRLFLERASRSLRAYAELLQAPKSNDRASNRQFDL